MKFDPDLFKQEPVLGIVRGVPQSHLKDVLDTTQDAGLKFLEITLNTDNALQLIASATEHCGEALCIGAGTVLIREQAEAAVTAGARFLVAPTLNEEVAAFCRKRVIPYFPGALTPTEIERAWNAGAAMVVADKAGDLKSGVAVAAEAVDGGRGRAVLDRLVEITNRAPLEATA